MNLHLWLVFLSGVFLSAILPGAGAIITLNHAFQRGWKKTLPLIAGQATALCLMVPMVALSAESLRASATAWLLLKSISVLWLLFAAYKTWHAPVIIDTYEVAVLTSTAQRFFCGFLTDITNAKALAFLVAALPVFLNPSQPLKPQIVIMTLTMVIVDTLMMALYALIAARLRPYFQSPTALKRQNQIFAGFLMFIAVSICFLENSN
ncbi:LysE family translocator [Candidatus Steffania adelgidicola]|uniref:LysE family translocator n=1 Tax=Candidatus Steffania adelgidicola TaxID=1076626 RepID=UPI001D016D0A|nr:LysE family transporter [Candidatus Steffania adelgidicola]UDG80073.1 Homoserine/homoserine lactone efflux protein [Candidatus Steffania adelgidicola]